MKQILFLFYLLFSAQLAFSQSIRFGVKAGANYADINGKALDDNAHRYKLGWHAGLVANLQYPGNTWFSVQSELLYSRKGYENTGRETEISDGQGNLLYRAQNGGFVRLNYLELPVLLNFRSGIIVFEFGPQLSYLVGYRNDAFLRQEFVNSTVVITDDNDRRFAEDRLRKLDIGLATGFRLETENGVGMGLRFNQGLLKLDNGDSAGRNEARAPQGHNQVFQLYASFLLPE